MTHQLTLFSAYPPEVDAQAHRVEPKRKDSLVEQRARRLAKQMFREWVEEYQPTVNDLPAKERPVNRLIQYGPGALSTGEVLAVIIGGGQQLQLANTLLAHYDGLTGVARAAHGELTNNGFDGIGDVTAARIKAAFELGRRLLISSPTDKPQVKSPADGANLVMSEMSLLEQEHLRTILLDSKNHVIKVHTVYVGSLNTSVVRVGEIFREAIRLNCAALIVVHNHPSGDPTPSPEDVKVTELIVQAGQLMDIEVLDHLIIGQQRYVSLKERGLGF
jgi:DNA repair protein RadC